MNTSTPTTMVGLFDHRRDDPDANYAAMNKLLGGSPWFVPDPGTPACGEVLHVPAASTTDHTERRFVCDRAAGHPPEIRDAGEPSEVWHRQVTDAENGQTLEWRHNSATILQNASATDPLARPWLSKLALIWSHSIAKLAEHHGDAHAAAADPELFHAWDTDEPEHRAALLLAAAREHTGPAPATDTPAGMYAAELHRYAREHTGTPTEFIGHHWPALPLPGNAGTLATSIAFDRDDTDISLTTLLLLAGGH